MSKKIAQTIGDRDRDRDRRSFLKWRSGSRSHFCRSGSCFAVIWPHASYKIKQLESIPILSTLGEIRKGSHLSFLSNQIESVRKSLIEYWKLISVKISAIKCSFISLKFDIKFLYLCDLKFFISSSPLGLGNKDCSCGGYFTVLRFELNISSIHIEWLRFFIGNKTENAWNHMLARKVFLKWIARIYIFTLLKSCLKDFGLNEIVGIENFGVFFVLLFMHKVIMFLFSTGAELLINDWILLC